MAPTKEDPWVPTVQDLGPHNSWYWFVIMVGVAAFAAGLAVALVKLV